MIRVNDVMGEKKLIIMAGPCAIESRNQILRIAQNLANINGVHALRGGAYKLRTSPHSFQGLGKKGLEYLRQVKRITNLPIITEIIDTRDVDLFLRFGVDIFQVGTRNAQNYTLLKELKKKLNEKNDAVLLKRGKGSSLKELEGCIEYLKGIPIFVCLRGLEKMDYHNSEIAKIRDSGSFQNPDYRFYSDVQDIQKVKSFPSVRKGKILVGFDPSHVGGKWEYVPRIAKEAVENGADFLLVETVLSPEDRHRARCDGRQGITVDQLEKLIPELQEIHSHREHKR